MRAGMPRHLNGKATMIPTSAIGRDVLGALVLLGWAVIFGGVAIICFVKAWRNRP